MTELPPILTGDEQNQIRQLRDYLIRLAQTPQEQQESTTSAKDGDGGKLAALDLRVKGIWDRIYPVGSIYMSVNAASPAVLFGGTWERIKDTFLLSAGDAYAAGATGGEAAHTLTVDEMPNHDHAVYGMRASHTLNTRNRLVLQDDGNMVVYSSSNAVKFNASSTETSGSVSYRAWQAGIDGTSGNKGGDQAHNNMPPYLAVYVWKRTA